MNEYVFMFIAVVLLFIIFILALFANSSKTEQQARAYNTWILVLAVIGTVGLSLYGAYYMYTSKQRIISGVNKIAKRASDYISKKAL